MNTPNFDIVYEEVKLDLINEGIFDKFKSYFNKNWSLKEEFQAILPFVIKRVKNEFKNLYETNVPGVPELENNGKIEALDEGSSKPGFKVTYELSNDYVEQKLLPCLLQNKNSKFFKLNEKYKFSDRANNLNPELVIMLYTESTDELDLGKDGVQVKKLSIKNWDGKLYINFDVPSKPKDQSNISIGTIKVKLDVKDYDPLIIRMMEWFNNAGSGRTPDKELTASIGASLRDIFGVKQKENKLANYDRISKKSIVGNVGKTPEGVIKCSITFDKNLKKQHDLDADEYTRYSRKPASTNSNGMALPNNLHLSYQEDICELSKILTRVTLNQFANLILYTNTSDRGMAVISNDMQDLDSWESAVSNRTILGTKRKTSNKKIRYCMLYM